jgi:hypothetical protein
MRYMFFALVLMLWPIEHVSAENCVGSGCSGPPRFDPQRPALMKEPSWARDRRRYFEQHPAEKPQQPVQPKLQQPSQGEKK